MFTVDVKQQHNNNNNRHACPNNKKYNGMIGIIYSLDITDGGSVMVAIVFYSHKNGFLEAQRNESKAAYPRMDG